MGLAFSFSGSKFTMLNIKSWFMLKMTELNGQREGFNTTTVASSPPTPLKLLLWEDGHIETPVLTFQAEKSQSPQFSGGILTACTATIA